VVGEWWSVSDGGGGGGGGRGGSTHAEHLDADVLPRHRRLGHRARAGFSPSGGKWAGDPASGGGRGVVYITQLSLH
jgi:hypothetical protein